MTNFTGSDDLRGTEFRGVRLGAARFVESDLSDVVIRGSEVAGMEIDAPWLVHGEPVVVNGVDIVAFVEAELDRRFPGRSQRRADDADGLRSAWAAVEQQWAATLARVETMPPGTVDISVAGEWSFAQTLRHLVHATDLWLGRSVLELERPLHPLGLSYTMEPVADSGAATSYEEVLEVRAGRVAMVRDLLATITDEELATIRRNPHDPDRPETTRSCLHVILGEEWEHHRFAVRDLDLIESGDGVAATHRPPDSA
jgi:uncharacterized damage-inducible protein DinB